MMLSKQLHQNIYVDGVVAQATLYPESSRKKTFSLLIASFIAYFKRDIAGLSGERDNNESLACFVDDSGSGSVIALSSGTNNKEHERRDNTTHKARYSLGSRLSALVFICPPRSSCDKHLYTAYEGPLNEHRR